MLSNDKLAGFLSGIDSTTFEQLVLGKPVLVQETTMLPILSVSAAYGGSSGQQGVGGGGIRLDPVAIVVMVKDRVSVYSLRPGQVANPLASLAALLPEILSPGQEDQLNVEQGDPKKEASNAYRN